MSQNKLTITNLTNNQIDKVLLNATFTNIDDAYLKSLKPPETGCLSLDSSPCCFINTQGSGQPSKRRSYVINSVHYTGYFFVAWQKFGSFKMNQIKGTKNNRNDLTISHLCGTKMCCTPSHIILEAKYINDERTHCHYAMGNILQASGLDEMVNALAKGLCPHIPICGGQRGLNQSNKHFYY